MKTTLSRASLSIPKLKSDTQTLPSSINLLFHEAQRSHAHVLKSGIPIPESKIVHLYCNSKAFSDAHQLFDETPQWDLVSATAVIGAFARHGRCKDAIAVFARVLHLGIRPNQFTFGTVIHTCTSLREHDAGKQLHSCAMKMGLQSNVFVGSSVLDHYAKLGSIEEAQRAFEDTHDPNVVSYTTLIFGYLKNERFKDALWIFSSMPERNIVSWNAMIGGCSQTGQNEEAVNLFVEMCREGLRPNQSTFPCVFTAAANIGALGMGKSFHAHAIKHLIQSQCVC
ncbi:pentatricopeptide repeat-containing protein, mitochondrial [Cinnamomum micranthum f. kanehirae]|uniref:Pentatricopeptide repeat-containing protein, mitochondrial n=1 Tax=Cinnamomum micranthum f. kanehirae TaxID=337451 RepID=A0A3S3NCA1_9MAGN|nr:pentatricopeptide repeat-containing protein, mitochondrial [Cinnamomum micranthum f. kanehirae]